MTTILLTRPMIREMLKAGTITREAALARCDEIIARPGVSENKRKGWQTLRGQVVAGGPIDIAATYAHLKPAATPAAKPAKAKAAPKATAQADDPMTAIARQMEALTAAFAALAAKR
jgi:hypothetical protein